MVMRVLSNGGRGDVESLKGSLFCSDCGLCESYSCPQDLSPRALIAEMKAELKRSGGKLPQGIKANVEDDDAEYRRVSVDRLTMRLGLKKYDRPAPISESFETSTVKILLAQHIGAPAEACVSVGDKVKQGDVIATAKNGALSVNVHASIDGKVTSVTPKYIKISK